MTPPIRPLDPGVPQAPKPKGEKTFCNIKCTVKSNKILSRALPGPDWLVKNIFARRSLDDLKKVLIAIRIHDYVLRSKVKMVMLPIWV